MQKAVECAVKIESGDVVLLAPAASSFDQYDNFERRGEDFAEQVERITKPCKKRLLIKCDTFDIQLLILSNYY